MAALACFAAANYFYEGGSDLLQCADFRCLDAGDNRQNLRNWHRHWICRLDHRTANRLSTGRAELDRRTVGAGLYVSADGTAFLGIRPAVPVLGPRAAATRHISCPERIIWRRVSRRALQDTREYPGLLRYMIGNFLVIDAVNTVIIFMGVYSSTVIGFEEGDKLVLFISSTTFALFGSIFYGYLTDKIKSKPAMLISVVGWIVALCAATVASEKAYFYVIGAFFGVFLGAVWTASRPLLNTLVPEEKLGQFYGVYSLCSKAAATIGPLVWGIVALVGTKDMPLGKLTLDTLSQVGIAVSESLASTIHYRLALAAQIVALVAGFIVLLKVPNRKEYLNK